MKNKFQIETVGSVRIVDDTYSIHIDKKYLPALTNIEGFSHLQIVWWGHLTDSSQDRDRLIKHKLFKKGPDKIGVFATRSPARPNPILISTIKIQEIDFNAGIIYTPFIDADDKTPVLDIKPYFSMERVKDCEVPKWCEHWPQWFESSMEFNWLDEIVNR
jgi:tRNA-Thr(GGU) m(6)t(6)A37 methyltransferase TsaA